MVKRGASAATTTPERKKVAVVGAGISGLAAAYRLQKEGASVTVFEADDHPGGIIQSFTKDGFTWEKGPNTMAENDPLVGDLIAELQIEEKRQWPKDQSIRYVVRDDKVHKLPANPLGLLNTKLLTPQAKLRLLAEPFLWQRRKAPAAVSSETGAAVEEEDESIGDFVERHVGREPVDYLLDPFVAGTSGSSPQTTSARYGFSELWKLEKEHGSLFVGLVANAFSKKKKKAAGAGNPGEAAVATGQPKRKPKRGSFSFQGGLQTLANALYERVGQEKVLLRTPVNALEWGGPSLAGNEWKVGYTAGGKKQERSFDAVICTAPLEAMKSMKVVRQGKQLPLSARLPQVTYQPMAVLINSFKREDVERAMPGFGVLIPAKEKGFRSLGTIFSTLMFPDRAPDDGYITFTTFVGGSRARDLASRPMEEVQAVALADLQKLVGVKGEPAVTKHIYWERAFPEYGLGYGKVLAAVERLEQQLPGLYVAGNHVGGLAVGKALLSGHKAAGRALSDLRIAVG